MARTTAIELSLSAWRVSPTQAAAPPRYARFFRFGFRLIFRSRLRLVLDDQASVNQPLPRLIGQVEGKRAALLRGHLRQALRDRAGDVDLLTILPFLRLPARQPSQRR